MFCPVCKSNKVGFFADKNTYHFYRCRYCKTIFLNKLPSLNILNKYYSQQFLYESGQFNELIIRKRSREILKKIKSCFPQARTLCDVGSGYGYFLDEAVKEKYAVFGIEPSKKLRQFAKKNYSFSFFPGTLENYVRKNPKKFDVVTCIHVIEHISQPKKFVSLLLKLVKPGGLLYLETPNSDSHLLYAEREQYTFLIPPEHLWLFSQASIKKLLPKNAQVFSVNTYSYSEHFMGILKKIIKPNQPALNIKAKNIANNKSQLPFRKRLSYFVFDQTMAPLFTPLLNLNHKGSILEVYVYLRQ